MLYDAFIFDLDGTLTDSQEGIRNCVVYALEKLGRPIPGEDVLRRFMGPPLADSFMRYCGMDEAEATRATDLYRERYIPVGWRENAVYPGVRAMLTELKRQGAYLAVATGKPEHTSRDILRYFGLLGLLDDVAGPRPEDLHADKGELIARVLPKGRRAVMIGDCASDIVGAKAREIDSVAARYGYDGDHLLMDAKPTHAVNDVFQMQELFLGRRVPDKGCFISVEGLDGCGKTTQMAGVEKTLRDFGFAVRRTREPGGCPISEDIRKIVLAQKENGLTDAAEALLFAAARAQHVHDVILPAMARGEIVLCDRFVDSSIAYQGGGRGLGEKTVRQINAPAVNGCMPDMTVYLKIDHETSIARRVHASSPDRIEQQDDAFFLRVERAYETLLKEEPTRFIVVDARRGIEAVAQETRDKLIERLTEKGFV